MGVKAAGTLAGVQDLMPRCRPLVSSLALLNHRATGYRCLRNRFDHKSAIHGREEYKHTAILTKLPYHHRDPFDRLIIAQALSEHMQLISTDSIFDTDPVMRLW